MVLELEIVTGDPVAFRQVAKASVGLWLVTVALAVSEIAHIPTRSGIIGHIPFTLETSENFT
jgi:hypothetical protein